MRKENPDSPLGYRHWWLTLDRVAIGLSGALRDALGKDAPNSPAMDPSYLVRVLRMSRTRTKIDPSLRLDLPVLLDLRFRSHRPLDLIRTAETLREQNSDKSERVIRHIIRDRMDELRTLKVSRSAGDAETPKPFELEAGELEEWT